MPRLPSIVILTLLSALLSGRQLTAQSFRSPNLPIQDGATLGPGAIDQSRPSSAPRTLGEGFDFVPQTTLKPALDGNGTTGANRAQFQGKLTPMSGGERQGSQNNLRSLVEGNENADEPVEAGVEIIRQRYPDGKVQIKRHVRRDEDDNYYNDGPWILYNRQGQVLAEGQFEKGQMVGIWKRWHPQSGTGIFSRTPFQQFSGPFQSVASFKNGQLDGVWSLFDRMERKVFEIPYREGQRDGTASWWFANSMKMREVTFKQGLIDGHLREWNEQNKVTRDEEFVEGKRIIRQVTMFRPQVKKSESYFLDSKLEPDGKDEWWGARPAGFQPTTERVQHGPVLFWHDNGQPQMRGTYEDGLRVGVFTWWHRNGQKQLQGEYQDGLKEGVWIWWHSTGFKATEGRYERDQAVGVWTQWNEDGEMVDQSEIDQPDSQESTSAADVNKKSILDGSEAPIISDSDTQTMEEIETPNGTNVGELPEQKNGTETQAGEDGSREDGSGDDEQGTGERGASEQGAGEPGDGEQDSSTTDPGNGEDAPFVVPEMNGSNTESGDGSEQTSASEKSD